MGYNVKRILKVILWKILKRDYFLLRPDLTAISSGGAYTLIGQEAIVNKTYLPIRYNYHTPREWKLVYDIRGNAWGFLKYNLSTPNSVSFCELEMQIHLPFRLTIELHEDRLTWNGIPFRIKPDSTIPRDAPWLVGEFELCDRQDQILYRRTGHRVQIGEGEADSSYFNGLVYENYDRDAVWFPRQVLKTIQEFHPLNGRLLDVGCATGLLVEYAMSQGLDAEGVDGSRWAIEIANLRTNGHCKILNFDEARLADFLPPFDIITLHSVIEHLTNPEHAIHLLFELCRPGGAVYIQTLNADSLMHRIMAEDWGGYTDYTHQSPWITADWLMECSKQAGFEVVYLKRSYVWNDNIFDDVWQSFTSFIQMTPANVLLEDQFGDAVEVILHKPCTS